MQRLESNQHFTLVGIAPATVANRVARLAANWFLPPQKSPGNFRRRVLFCAIHSLMLKCASRVRFVVGQHRHGQENCQRSNLDVSPSVTLEGPRVHPPVFSRQAGLARSKTRKKLLAAFTLSIANIASPRRKLLVQVCFKVDDLRHGLFDGIGCFGFHRITSSRFYCRCKTMLFEKVCLASSGQISSRP